MRKSAGLGDSRLTAVLSIEGFVAAPDDPLCCGSFQSMINFQFLRIQFERTTLRELLFPRARRRPPRFPVLFVLGARSLRSVLRAGLDLARYTLSHFVHDGSADGRLCRSCCTESPSLASRPPGAPAQSVSRACVKSLSHECLEFTPRFAALIETSIEEKAPCCLPLPCGCFGESLY